MSTGGVVAIGLANSFISCFLTSLGLVLQASARGDSQQNGTVTKMKVPFEKPQ